MPVCLHCGEIAPEGALFCGKCGYTLPQPGSPAAAAGSPIASTPTPAVPRAGPPGAVVPPRHAAAPASSGSYVVAVEPGAVGPIPPPPNAKYCPRCGAVISFAAVYCPVCQQPQA